MLYRRTGTFTGIPLQPQTGIEAKGELELSVYNDKLNITCKVSEMSEYVKQPYNPNN